MLSIIILAFIFIIVSIVFFILRKEQKYKVSLYLIKYEYNDNIKYKI